MKKVLHLMIAMIILTGLSFGQGSADIYGVVLLADGSAIPGAVVTLTGDVIGAKTAVSSEEGNYRFISLPPGNYELKFELEGFKTVVQRGIRVIIGKSSNINVTLETSSIKEEVTISGKATVVDTRKSNVGVNLSGEQLRALPTARNPWTMLSLVPGMMMDRADVGGAESGQQSGFYGNGADAGDTQWNVDGANLTDASALGAAPSYMNVSAYEEMQVNVGANDISAQTGGAQINFVSKRGGNKFSGDFHLMVQDKAWELTQNDVPAEMIAAGFQSPGINRLKQYGVNFGGPIINDKLWFFGSYAIQDIVARTERGTDDATLLVSGYAKLNFQLGNLTGEAQFTNDEKLKWGRLMWGAAEQAPNTTWDQYGPTQNYRGSLQYVTGNLMLSAKGIYTDGGFAMDPVRGARRDSTGHFNTIDGREWYRYALPSRYMENGNYYYGADRNSTNLGVDGNYFLENVIGGDHEFKFGVDYYKANSLTETLYPNQRWTYIQNSSTPATSSKHVRLLSDGKVDISFDRLSFFLQDTASFGKLTVNVGVRYDRERSYQNATNVPGLSFNGQSTPWMQKWLPAITVKAGEMKNSGYDVISPRISLSYDLTGDGQNVVKLAIARYGSTAGTTNAGFNLATASRQIRLPWDDSNGDLVPQLEEINFSENTDDWIYNTINTLDPSSPYLIRNYDDNHNSPLLDELTLSYEKAIGSDMAVSLTGFYKKRHNLLTNVGVLEVDVNNNPTRLDTINNYTIDRTLTFPDGSTRPLYNRAEPFIGYTTTNLSADNYQRYLGAQLVLTKKLADNWMADVSFVYQDWRNFLTKEEYLPANVLYIEGTGPTNWDYYNEGVVAPEPGGSGQSGVFVNSRWEIKVNGLYQLPGGINLTGVFQTREGYVIPKHMLVSDFGTGVQDDQRVYYGNKIGDDRLPTFWMLNLGLEKTFKLSDTANLTLMVNGYNITNNTTVMKVNPILGQPTSGDAQKVLNAGNFQFGVRVNF